MLEGWQKPSRLGQVSADRLIDKFDSCLPSVASVRAIQHVGCLFITRMTCLVEAHHESFVASASA